MSCPRWLLMLGLCCLPVTALAVSSMVEKLDNGVYVVRDDGGIWDGHLSLSITHQSNAPYQAKKILDFSDVPEDVWAQVREIRVSAYIMVRDYPPLNGLDEAFEVVVNGNVHRYPTNCGAPVFNSGKEADWYDFVIPKEEFTRGHNEVVLRKAPSDKNDDYLYLCISHDAERGNSTVSFDSETWREDMLTIPGGKGEYMVRAYLLTEDTGFKTKWCPGGQEVLQDSGNIVVYAGSETGEISADGLSLAPGQSARVEWEPAVIDQQHELSVMAEASGSIRLSWLNETGKVMVGGTEAAQAKLELAAEKAPRTFGVEITALEQPVILREVNITGGKSFRTIPGRIDMCPRINEPAGRPEKTEPACSIERRIISLKNTGLTAIFQTGRRLQLTSLYNHYTNCEMVTDPDKVWLFLLEVAGERYTGAKDFLVHKIKPLEKGFIADLRNETLGLQGLLKVQIGDEGLRLGLEMKNIGTAPVDFKLAFPHMAGLTPSGDIKRDYYYFPWGGGIIADTPATIRRGYGSHEALYQVIDLFSPERGGGLYVRADDSEGWHKVLALGKYVPGQAVFDAQMLGMQTAEEYKWTNPLERVNGIGFAYEYLRRTREPGKAFIPADVVLAAHPGDWHVAMQAYVDWAHKVWKFRPWPSRLRNIHHMIATGWANDYLYKDGKYRDDFILPETDCIELMSWWDWSPLGPWSTPFDKLNTVLDEATIKMWEPYFVKDPVTGQTMWNNQPGDYDGYNQRFGGLPAFRDAIQTYQKMGAMVTLYTDPLRCDDATKIGQKYGKLWGGVQSNGEYWKNYDVWNMCHDVAQYQQWVANTMKRVMVETGADGIRLDEYGHGGFACFSKLHQHNFAEPGVVQWNKGIAEATKLVRQAMDEVAPGSVLTTEHPGYDYLLQYIEGCITYDMTVQATSMRPLECNTQRFYFPECKAYELDHMGADLESKKKIWNAVESFGRHYPPVMYSLLKENEDIYQSKDCAPLIPTEMRYVYANRFGTGDKMMYHLYNATGHTVDGIVLAPPVNIGQHVFDMLNHREVPLRRDHDRTEISLYIPRDGVCVLAKLNRQLDINPIDNLLIINTRSVKPASQLVVCDKDGQALISQAVQKGNNSIYLEQVPEGKIAVCVKLLCDGQLIDIIEIPSIK